MSANKVMSIDEMLAADDVEYAVVEVFGSKVRLGSLTAEQILAFNESNADAEKKRMANIRTIVLSLVDENGNRIGTEEHVVAFARKSAKSIMKLMAAVNALNMGKDGAEALQAAAKNDSSEAATVASPTV